MMAFERRLFLILLCVRMLMAATVEKRAATDGSDLRFKCPGEQMCACITESNSFTRCEVNCNADCNDLTTDGTKCFSELACYPNLLFEIDADYNGQCRDEAATTTTITRPSCICNGQHDFIGLGGSCQSGLNGYWCYVDEEADCDNKDSYNGKFISVSPCIGKATTTHCSWGEWSSWSSCSATCGGGSQYATRNMANQATGGGELCKGSPVKIQQCGRTDCPTDCVWGEWSSWSSCSATCGGGSQSATRQMAIQATGGGELCQGEPVKSQQCGLTQCDSATTTIVRSGYDYLYFPLDTQLFTFKVKSTNDVHVTLSADARGYNVNEIVIGGWANSQSTIRRGRQGSSISGGLTSTPQIVSPTEFRGFWITTEMDKGKRVIKVGKDGESTPFMTGVDNNPLRHIYVGLSGWGDATAAYVFPTPT